MTVPDLLLLGASTRAAAFSALRANLQPIGADLFADADLQAHCRVIRVPSDNYPNGLLRAVADLPMVPWMYTGSLENHPRLVAKLARQRPLLGNDAAVLKKVRSPFAIAEVLRSVGLPRPAVLRPENASRAKGRWLIKPLAGAGGTGIHFLTGATSTIRSPRHVYLQEYVAGVSCAAVYLGDGQQAHLLGAARQLVGQSWLHVSGFRYCGSIGPMQLAPSLKKNLQHLGAVLASAFGLRGPFGVDFILKDGVAWPVEINPRYTASVEVLEYATGMSVLAVDRESWETPPTHAPLPGGEGLGVRARGSDVVNHSRLLCRRGVGEEEIPSMANGKWQMANGKLPPQAPSPLTPHPSCLTPVCGKAILFARTPLLFPENGPWQETLRQSDPIREMPTFADIPHPGERIEAGRPILTLFARAVTEDACLTALQKTAGELEDCLYAATSRL